MLILLASIAIVTQSAVMVVDELFFHRRRNVPRWERIGHPLDTLTVVVCYAITLLQPVNAVVLRAFVAFAIFSCIFVTKDEFVHARECSPMEHWLHSVLFMLHPIVLAGVGLLWIRHHYDILAFQGALTCTFGVYQTLYWNTPWTKPAASR